MLQLRVMGEAVLQAPNGRLVPSAPRVFSLALLLALDREHPWERDDLARVIWPDAELDKARHNLRQGLYRMRGVGISVRATADRVALSRETQVRTDELSLSEPIEVLSESVVSGTRKVGPFLGSYDPAFSPRLRDWVEEQRIHAHARLRTVLAQCLEHFRRTARWASVEQIATQLLHYDPLNEGATLALAEVAALTGDKVGAVKMLERYTEEVGAVSKDIAIPARVLRKRVSELPVGPTLAGIASQPLVGRETELQLCYRFLELAREERVRALTITGGAGLGKSRLLNEFIIVGRTLGFSSVLTECDRPEPRTAFGSVTGLVRALLELPGALGISPEHLELLTSFASGNGDTALEDSLVDACTELVENLCAERALLLVIDDADEMHADALTLLARVSQALRSEALALIMSTRTDALVGGRMTRESDQTVVAPLAPLGLRATEQLTKALMGDGVPQSAVNWIVQRSNGNPRDIGILVSHWEVTRTLSTPPAILEGLRRQLRQLTQPALRLLHFVSTAHSCRNLNCVQALTGFSLSALYDYMVELETSKLISMQGGNIVIHNPLVAEAISHLNGSSSISVVHRVIATHLDAEHSAESSTALEWERAYHWLLAGDSAKARAAVRVCLGSLWRSGEQQQIGRLAQTVIQRCETPHLRQQFAQFVLTALEERAQWSDLLALTRQLPYTSESMNTDAWADISNAFATFRDSGDAHASLSAMRSHVFNTNLIPSVRVRAADFAMRLADLDIERATLNDVYHSVQPYLDEVEDVASSALVCTAIYHSTCGSITEAMTAGDALVELGRAANDSATLGMALRFRAIVYSRSSLADEAKADLRTALDLCVMDSSRILTAITAGRLLELSINLDETAAAASWFGTMEEAYEKCKIDQLSNRARTILTARYLLSRSDEQLPELLRRHLDFDTNSVPVRELLEVYAVRIQDSIRCDDRRTVQSIVREMASRWSESMPDNGVDYAAAMLVLGQHWLGDKDLAKRTFAAHLARRREPGAILPGILRSVPEAVR